MIKTYIEKDTIKFRGLSIYSKKFHYGTSVWVTKNGHMCRIYDKVLRRWVQVIPKTVGQYTGRKEKNGKEIYKDDILQMEDSISRATVFWNKKEACFDSEHYFAEEFSLCKVIGNIHENEDLLNE